MRPKSVPEMRGMPPIDRDRDRPFSPKSYAAQYGITVEDAEDLLAECQSHPQMHRKILALFLSDPDLKRRALMLEETSEMTAEEREGADRLLKRLGLAPLSERERP